MIKKPFFKLLLFQIWNAPTAITDRMARDMQFMSPNGRFFYMLGWLVAIPVYGLWFIGGLLQLPAFILETIVDGIWPHRRK